MEQKKFTCCQNEPRFMKVKQGYQCAHCGKIYPSKLVDYNGKSFLFSKLKYQAKFRGDKADYIHDDNESIFATIHTGIVDIMYMNKLHEVYKIKSIKVKKSAKEIRLNFNRSFLTITDSGVIDVYDIETGQIIAQYKTRKECNCFKLNILPFSKNGNWIYIDTQSVIRFSHDFKESQTILMFADLFEEGVYSVNGAMNYADNNSRYDKFVFHVMYWTWVNGKKWLKGASVALDFNKENYTIKKVIYDAEDNMTYDFKKQIYYGICHDDMISMDEKGQVQKLQILPSVKSYSDGGGIFWLEEFVGYSEKIRFLTDDKIVLIYAFSIIIFNIEKQKIIASFDTRLIQSFFVMDSDTICFSAGVNTYIIKLDDGMS